MLTGLGRFRALRTDKPNVQRVKRRHRAWKDDDVAGDIRNTKRFRELTALLRERAGQEGVMLVGGEAEIILADRVTAIASQLRVTQRTALDYVSEDNLELLIQKLSSLAEEYDDAVQTAEPISIKITDTGRVVAALGMAVKLAAEHIEGHQADAAGITTDGADALVGLGMAMSAAGDVGEFQFGGQHLVWTRKVLLRTIELISNGTWACPCEGPHSGTSACRLQRQLTGDLYLVGGWLPGEH
jgi:hypothetical protein